MPLKTLENERKRIAAEMHDELGAGLSKITHLTQVMVRETGDAAVNREIALKIQNTCNHLQSGINEIIWSLDPQHDYLHSLLAFLRYSSAEFLENSTVRLDFNFPSTPPTLFVPGTFRRNIQLIVKEALNNILKHSCATNATISASISKSHIQIKIEDNGCGITNQHRPVLKNGLRNMEERALSMAANFSITSTAGMGTVLNLEIPICQGGIEPIY